MYGVDVTEAQAEHLIATIDRHRLWWERLHERMTALNFPPDDPLMLEVTRALLSIRETMLILNGRRQKGKQIRTLKRAKAWRRIG